MTQEEQPTRETRWMSVVKQLLSIRNIVLLAVVVAFLLYSEASLPLIVFTLVGGGFFILRREREQSELTAAAQPVIAALEAFKSANGRYPRWIDELIPRHISELPELMTRRKLRYKVTEEGDEFRLICNRLVSSATYFSRRGRWLRD